MDHHVRRWLLHDAVEQLEPAAHSGAIRDYVKQRCGLDLPLVRIYVDLERLVAEGYLLREKRALPAAPRATFFWETTGKVPVRPGRPSLKTDKAAAPLEWARLPCDAVARSRAEASYEVV